MVDKKRKEIDKFNIRTHAALVCHPIIGQAQ